MYVFRYGHSVRIFVVVCSVFVFGKYANAQNSDIVSVFLNGGTNSLTEPSFTTASPLDTIDGRGGVSFTGKYYDWYRSGGMEQSGSSFTRTAGVSVWQSFRSPIPFALRLRQMTGYTRLDRNVSTEHFTFYNSSDELACDIIAVPYRWFWLLAGITGDRALPANMIFGGGVTVPRYFSTALQWTAENQSSHINAVWEGNAAEIWLRTRTEGMAGSISTTDLLGVRLIAEGMQKNWIRDQSFFGNPTFSPWGQSVSYRGALQTEHNQFTCAIGVRGYRYDCMAYGYKNDLTFSKLTAIHFRQDGWFGSIQWQRAQRKLLVTELEYQHFGVYSRGHIEFWPFTSGWESLLGARRYYITNTSGNFWRVRIATDDVPLDSKTRLGVTCDYVDCIVDASLQHWRPAFLIFGVADYQYSMLDLQRVSATQLGFRINHAISRFRLEYEFQQTIPLRQQYRSAAPTTPQPTPSTGTKHGAEYGGAIHTISLVTYW